MSNGLLLRSDIHTLYDLSLIKIDGSGKIFIHEDLKEDPTYKDIDSIPLITFPKLDIEKLALMKAALNERYEK